MRSHVGNANHYTHEFCHFRLIRMPCCEHLLCWVNPRLPNFCPECGKKVFTLLKLDPSYIRHSDPRAELKVSAIAQGLLGGFSARPEHKEDYDDLLKRLDEDAGQRDSGLVRQAAAAIRKLIKGDMP